MTISINSEAKNKIMVLRTSRFKVYLLIDLLEKHKTLFYFV